MAFEFFDPFPLVDGELELIAPEARWIDELLRTCAQPAGRGDPTAGTTRKQIEDFLAAAPGGHYMPKKDQARVPAYHFWMRLNGPNRAGVVIAGSIGLRVGDSDDLRMYLERLGYNVYPAARGHRYAERACRLLLPLARRHGLREIWVTCNPENLASRRTCERLGALWMDTVALPPSHTLYQRGERHKCRYRLSLVP